MNGNEENSFRIGSLEIIAGVYILQMTLILFPGRTDHAPKIFAIEGNPTPPN